MNTWWIIPSSHEKWRVRKPPRFLQPQPIGMFKKIGGDQTWCNWATKKKERPETFHWILVVQNRDPYNGLWKNPPYNRVGFHPLCILNSHVFFFMLKLVGYSGGGLVRFLHFWASSSWQPKIEFSFGNFLIKSRSSKKVPSTNRSPQEPTKKYRHILKFAAIFLDHWNLT